MPGFTFRPPPGAGEGRKVKVQRSAETEEHATKVNAGNRKWEVLLPLPEKALARAGAFLSNPKDWYVIPRKRVCNRRQAYVIIL